MFPGPIFEHIALTPETALGRRFELVLAQEFYPFTRTADTALHGAYLDLLLRHLEPGGICLIVLSERDRHKTILSDLGAASRRCHAHGCTLARRRLPFDRVFHHLPWLWPSLAASVVLGLRGYDRTTALIVEKPPSSATPPAREPLAHVEVSQD